MVGGTRTYERPEIGTTGGCTATLIAGNVAITAAHCWGYRSAQTEGRYGTFRIDLAANDRRSYSIQRYRSFGRNLGARDVTLLLLAEVVPIDVAVPATLATEEPARGVDASIWGYGCTNQSRQVGGGVKRVADVRYGSTDNLCPGDSGGPSTVGRDGAIWGINSSYGSRDGFGRPYQLLGEIQAQIDSWGAVYGPPGVDPNDDVAPPEVEVLSPQDGETRAENSTVEISARITDDLHLSRSELVWDFNSNTYRCPTSVQYVSCTVNGDIRTWTVQVSTGQRTFRVQAVDIAGNRTVSEDRTISLGGGGPPPPPPPPGGTDVDPPVITIVSPDVDAQTPRNSQIEIVAQITDESTLRDVEMIWDFNSNTYGCPSTSQYVDCTVSGDEYRWVVRVGREAPRPFHIRATDAGGHTSQSETRTVFVRDIRDEEPPVIEIVAPIVTDSLTAGTEIAVTARVTDNISVRSVKLDWSWYNNQVYPCPHRSQWVDCSVVGDEYRWRVRVGSGERRFIVRAADSAGNETATAEQTFMLQ